MKNLLSTFLIVLLVAASTAAQTNVGINNPNPVASAALMVDTAVGGPQGMLVPRMTQARRNAIPSPAEGLLVYQTDNTPGFYFYSGSAWTSVSGTGTGTGNSLQLLADKTNGTGESPGLSTTTSPATVSFNNVLSAPTSGNTWTGNNTFTVGTGQGGVYMVQVRLHGPDASTPSQTVGYSLIIQVNNTAYGAVGNVYGPYTNFNVYTPPGTKARGEIVTFIRLSAGDSFKVLAIGANSGTTPPSIATDAGSNITVMKMN